MHPSYVTRNPEDRYQLFSTQFTGLLQRKRQVKCAGIKKLYTDFLQHLSERTETTATLLSTETNIKFKELGTVLSSLCNNYFTTCVAIVKAIADCVLQQDFFNKNSVCSTSSVNRVHNRNTDSFLVIKASPKLPVIDHCKFSLSSKVPHKDGHSCASNVSITETCISYCISEPVFCNQCYLGITRIFSGKSLLCDCNLARNKQLQAPLVLVNSSVKYKTVLGHKPDISQQPFALYKDSSKTLLSQNSQCTFKPGIIKIHLPSSLTKLHVQNRGELLPCKSQPTLWIDVKQINRQSLLLFYRTAPDYTFPLLWNKMEDKSKKLTSVRPKELIRRTEARISENVLGVTRQRSLSADELAFAMRENVNYKSRTKLKQHTRHFSSSSASSGSGSDNDSRLRNKRELASKRKKTKCRTRSVGEQLCTSSRTDSEVDSSDHSILRADSVKSNRKQSGYCPKPNWSSCTNNSSNFPSKSSISTSFQPPSKLYEGAQRSASLSLSLENVRQRGYRPPKKNQPMSCDEESTDARLRAFMQLEEDHRKMKQRNQELLLQIDSLLSEIVAEKKERIQKLGEVKPVRSPSYHRHYLRIDREKSGKSHKQAVNSDGRNKAGSSHQERAGPSVATTGSGDVLIKYRDKFTEYRAYKPRILISQASSYLTKSKCYQSPVRRTGSAFLKAQQMHMGSSNNCDTNVKSLNKEKGSSGAVTRRSSDDEISHVNKSKRKNCSNSTSYAEQADTLCNVESKCGMTSGGEAAQGMVVYSTDAGEMSIDSAYTGSQETVSDGSSSFICKVSERQDSRLGHRTAGEKSPVENTFIIEPTGEYSDEVIRRKKLRRYLIKKIRNSGLYSDDNISAYLELHQRRFTDIPDGDKEVVVQQIKKDLGIKPKTSECVKELLRKDVNEANTPIGNKPRKSVRLQLGEKSTNESLAALSSVVPTLLHSFYSCRDFSSAAFSPEPRQSRRSPKGKHRPHSSLGTSLFSNINQLSRKGQLHTNEDINEQRNAVDQIFSVPNEAEVADTVSDIQLFNVEDYAEDICRRFDICLNVDPST